MVSVYRNAINAFLQGSMGSRMHNKSTQYLVMRIVIDVDEYEQLKLAASKLAESEKIINYDVSKRKLTWS